MFMESDFPNDEADSNQGKIQIYTATAPTAFPVVPPTQ